MTYRPIFAAILALNALLAAPALAQNAGASDPTKKANPDMKRVLDALHALEGKPIETLTAAQARLQPSAADAAAAVMKQKGLSTAPDPAVKSEDISIDGAEGQIPARVYRPADAHEAELPIIVYYHGGGFVIATLDTYDASARELSKGTGAIVVGIEYRKAPEHKFPASYDDAVAGYKWVVGHAKSLGGDPSRIAVAGESAGGNLAVNVAIAARDQKLTMPIHEVIIYPMAGTDLNTPSYVENANAKPLSKPMMAWFYKNLVRSDADLQDKRLDIVGKADLHALPPATVITDEIDPLRSEGETLAEKLTQAGVTVDSKTYPGVTHEFFGMGAIVKLAAEAEGVVENDLNTAFKRPAKVQ